MLALSPIFTQTGFSQAHDIMYTHTYMYCTYVCLDYTLYIFMYTYMGKGFMCTRFRLESLQLRLVQINGERMKYTVLLHTYDITIGKFIYTGCVTIVMLHGPSGN